MSDSNVVNTELARNMGLIPLTESQREIAQHTIESIAANAGKSNEELQAICDNSVAYFKSRAKR